MTVVYWRRTIRTRRRGRVHIAPEGTSTALCGVRVTGSGGWGTVHPETVSPSVLCPTCNRRKPS